MTTSTPPVPTMTFTPDGARAGAAAGPAAADLAPAIARACDRIAPSWPLDRLIAVNPLWGFVDAPMERAAAEVAALSGATLLMPRAWYRSQWEAGGSPSARRAGDRDAGADADGRDVLAALAHDERRCPPGADDRRRPTSGRDLGHAMPWGEYVVRHVSQTCAACFDEGQARWTPDRAAGLYPLWRDLAAHDRGPRLLMGLRGFREAAAALPADPQALIAEAMRRSRCRPGGGRGT
jgi:uncharacterized protein YbcC (UPF0753/DUF2309 family)